MLYYKKYIILLLEKKLHVLQVFVKMCSHKWRFYKVLLVQLCIIVSTMLVSLGVLAIIAHPYFTRCDKKNHAGITHFCNSGQVLAWIFAFIVIIILFIVAIIYVIYRELRRKKVIKAVLSKENRRRRFKTKRDKDFCIDILAQNSDVFKEIKKLVKTTWDAVLKDSISNCRDGVNLYHNKVHVKQIYEVTNKRLLDSFNEILVVDENVTYFTKDVDSNCEEMSFTGVENRGFESSDSAFESGSEHKCTVKIIDEIAAETEPTQNKTPFKTENNNLPHRDIVSREFCKNITSDLFPRGCPLSQCYLFHGSLPNVVTDIVQNGFDVEKEPPGLSKGAIHLYESCEKADQLADKKFAREDHDLFMILTRVVLGKVYENTEGPGLKVPCSDDHCAVESCNHPLKYDSALNGYINDFRHVLVYDPLRCYPHYVIMYDRTFARDIESSQL